MRRRFRAGGPFGGASRPGLRIFLVGVALLSLSPVLLLAGVIATRSLEHVRFVRRAALADEARTLATAFAIDGPAEDAESRRSRAVKWINVQAPATDRGMFLAEGDGTILAGAGLWPWAQQSKLPEAVMSALAGRKDALIESPGADGPAWKCALARPASGWIAGVCDAGADDEWAGSALLLRLAVAASSLLAAAGSAAALARRLMGPIQRLARQAELRASGIDGTSQTPPFVVAEFEALRLALARAAAILRQRQAAEQMALREAQTGYELLMSVVSNSRRSAGFFTCFVRFVNLQPLRPFGSRLVPHQLDHCRPRQLFLACGPGVQFHHRQRVMVRPRSDLVWRATGLR
jgi:hypothetical protein